ncbi:MAG: class I SAM-dependent methyltransferase [Anaerolineae bacterium]|jgi:2-polyprenyl-3-methyl-5-hydroxy-6-metoxy-1,4-benzoquinol methylase
MEWVDCNLCGADDTQVRFPGTLPCEPDAVDWTPYRCTHSGYGLHPPIVECRRCGLVYANPRHNRSDILESYEAVQDPLYVEEREGRVLTFEHHLRPLERLTGAPNRRRLLDVGAYTGVFVEIAAEHGWDAWGVEPSRWAVEAARERGLNVIQGTAGTTDLPPGSFDVVTMWDVIEHLVDPLKELRNAGRLLSPGGLLVIHTIDIGSLFARLLGKHWPWLMEMHLYYFSRHTLRMLLERAGFSVMHIRAQGRYLRLGYLMNRVGALIPVIGRPAERLVTRLGVRSVPVPVNLGDLCTVYACKER